MDVWVIRTPTDLRGAFADSARTHFIVPDALEPAVREAWDEIFAVTDPLAQACRR